MNNAGSDKPFSARYYAFALRDELPLPDDGWVVTEHYPDGRPGHDPENTACDDNRCRGDNVMFTMSDGLDDDFDIAMLDLSKAIDSFINRKNADIQRPVVQLPVRRCVAIVGGPWLDDDESHVHFARCFSLLQDSVKAFRHATSASIPNVTIERVWPLYYIIDADDKAAWVNNAIIVEHGNLPGAHIATEQQLNRAAAMLIAARREDPVELYTDFKLGARNATYTDGDYVEAALKAAAAAELLIKHTSWMLTWESLEESSGGADPIADVDAEIFTQTPKELIGGTLSRRLGGNWSSQRSDSPVGRWRHSIAKQRNAVIHRGHRPTEQEADETFNALLAFEEHVADRLAYRCREYPLTSLIVVGRDGLERRGAWNKIRATVNAVDNIALVEGYVNWLNQQDYQDDEGNL